MKKSMIQMGILLFLIEISLTQILTPIGNCLGNCRNCNSNNLRKCSGTRQTMCATGYNPNFDTSTCELNSMYKNPITSLTDFKPNQDLSVWSDITSSVCQYRTALGQLNKLTVLGPYSRSFALKRNYPIIKPFKIMILHFNIVRDSWTPFNDFILVYVNIAKKRLSTSEISIEFRRPIDSATNPIVCQNSHVANEARQIFISVPENTNATQLQIQFSSDLSATVFWGLTNIRMIYGCGKYSLVGQSGEICGKCETIQYFPTLIGSVMQGCSKCPIECVRCTSFAVCQQCQNGMILSDTRCIVPSNWQIIQLKNFVFGSAKKCQSLTFVKGNTTQNVLMIPDETPRLHNKVIAMFTLIYNEGQWNDNTRFILSLRTDSNTVKIIQLTRANLTIKAIDTCSQIATYHSLMSFSSKETLLSYRVGQKYEVAFEVTNGDGVQYGISDIRILQTQCGGDNCLICNDTQVCKICKGLYSLNSNCRVCPIGYGGPECFKCNPFCRQCSSISTNECTQCETGFTLKGQQCKPINSDFLNYLIEEQFKGGQQISSISCQGKSSLLSTGSFRLSSEAILPKHQGLALGMKVYRVGQWNGKIQISLNGRIVRQINTETSQENKGHLCQISGQPIGSSTDLIFAHSFLEQDHSDEKIRIEIQGDGQIAVNDITLMLGNCQQCAKEQENDTNTTDDGVKTTNLPPFPETVPSDFPNIEILPVVPSQSLQSGIRLKMDLQYPHPIQMEVLIDRLDPNIQEIMEYEVIGTTHFVYARVRQSFTSGLLEVYGQVPTLENEQTVDQSESSNRKLQTEEVRTILKRTLLRSTSISRFDALSLEDVSPLESLYQMFLILSWVAIIGYMVSVPFSLGIVFEDLILNMGNLFLIAYINSDFLPFSLRTSIGGLWRMENLNFLIEEQYLQLQSSWIGNTVQDTPLYLIQFKPDLNFTRAYIPIIILNICFLIWFFIAALINYKYERDSQNGTQQRTKLSIFVQSVGGRPINYFDQIVRMQLMVTVWLSFIQFKNFSYPQDADRNEGINAALCLASFAVSIAWLVFIIIYTKLQQKKLALTLFSELYEDIFYRKSSLMEYPSVHVYLSLVLRYATFLLYAIAAAFTSDQPVVWLALAMVFNLVYPIYLWRTNVYTDRLCLILRTVDSGLFLVVSLLMIIIYGVGDNMAQYGFFVLGYFIVGVAVLIILNGMVRVGYLGFRKVGDLFFGAKDESQFVKPIDTQRVV